MPKAPKPAAQPRTLRSIAIGKARPEHFDTNVVYDSQAGIPMGTLGAGQTYNDVADAARGRGGQERASDPSPFK